MEAHNTLQPCLNLPFPTPVLVASTPCFPPPPPHPPICQNLNRSGVDPPLCHSRACVHTAFIAISVQCMFHVFLLPRSAFQERSRQQPLVALHPPPMQ